MVVCWSYNIMMADSSSSMLRLIRAVRSRLLLVSLLHSLPTAIGWGAALGGFWIALARLGVLDAMKLHALTQWTSAQPWYWLVSGAVGVCLVIGSIVAWVRSNRSLDHAAAVMDHRLHLKDRIRSALSFVMQTTNTTPAQQLAIEDALARCSSITPSRIVPISSGFGRPVGWSVSGLVLAAAVSAGLWLPEQHTTTDVASRNSTAAQRIAAQQIVSRVTSTTRQQIENAIAQQSEDGQIQSTLRSKLDELRQIEEELSHHDTTPEQALARSAETLQETADAIEQQATQDELTSEMLSDALKRSLTEGANRAPAPADASPVQDMLDALSRGDIDAAQHAAEALSRELPDMDQAAQEEIARELEKLADQLDHTMSKTETHKDNINPADNTSQSPSMPTATQPDEDRDSLDDQLQQQGIQDPDSFHNQTDKKTIEHELEQQGIDPSNARKLAEQLARRNQQQQAREQSRKELEQLQHTARQAADDLKRQTSEHPDTPRPSAHNQQSTDAPSTHSGRNSTSEQKSKTQPKAQPNTQPTQQPDTPSNPRPNEPSTSPSTQQHREQQLPNDTHQQSFDEPSKSTSPSKQPSSGQQVPKSIEELKHQLKKMAEHRQNAKKKKGMSRSMRKQAERLLKHASPEQRKDLERLAREMSREPMQAPSQHAPESVDSVDAANRMTQQETGHGAGLGRDGDEADGRTSAMGQDTPWQHEAFDARGEPLSHESQPGNNQIIADWFAPDKTDRIGDGQNAPATAGAQQTPKLFKQAVAQAAKVSEKQAIPRNRRDLVRRVFARYAQRSTRTRKASPTHDSTQQKHD